MAVSRIAAVVAHADDAEIWAGGTLLNHFDEGDSIALWYLHCPEELRRDEARRAAAAMGAQIQFPIQGDDLLGGLAAFRPDAIITHWERDSHVDHSRTCEMVRGLFPQLAIEFGVWPRVYSCDTYNSLGREPNETFEPTDIIDITDVWDRKLELLKAYTSQPMEYFTAMVERQGRLHGIRSGVQFAEAFRQIPLLGSARRHRRLLLSS